MAEHTTDAGIRGRHAWAIGIFALIVAANVGYVVNQRELGLEPEFLHEGRVEYSEVFGSLMTGALGLVLSWLRPRNPVGWLLMISGLCLAACDFGQAYGARALLHPEDGLPLGTVALSLSAPLWIGAVFIPASLLLVRYPTGRIEGRWPLRFDRMTIAGFALVYVAYATSLPAVTDQVEGHEPPLLLPEWLGGLIGVLGLVLLLGGTLLIVCEAVRRVIRSEPRQRAALLLLLVTATVAAVVIFIGPDDFGGSIAYFSTLAAITIGVLRYQALGIELVVRRTLLYAMLTGLVLLVFVGITTALATLVPSGPTPQIVAAVLIAVGLSPARDRLQGLVDRMLYGERGDPAVTLRRLGDSMGAAPSEGLLLAVVANLAETLRLDGAQVVGPDGRPIASWGSPAGGQGFALSFAGEDLGELRVSTRRGEATLGRADRQLLDTVTPLIAAVVHAVRLSDDLRTERNRVVQATEAERRRLRQELHDGLGPSLTGIGLGLEAAQAQPMAADPRTQDLLARLRTEVAASLDEIRRIIEALRPVSLDGADLVTALRRRTAAAAESGLEVRLVADELPTLPADVETAAFRIADEAINNVVRHASASHCTVTLSIADGRLSLRVADDGVGGAEERAGGVGMESMRERAERLGGGFTVSPNPAHASSGTANSGTANPGTGTLVVADLPLPAEPSLRQARTVTPAAANRHSGRSEPSLPQERA